MTAVLYRVRTAWSGVAIGGGLTVFYFGVLGTPSSGDAQAAVDATRDFWTSFAPRMHVNASWTVDGAVDTLDDTTGELEGFLGVTSRSGAGTQGGDILPLQIQGMIRWDTGGVADGHRLRGRTFMPGATEADSATGAVPSGTYVTALSTVAAALIANAATSFAIWHRPIPADRPHGPRAGTSLPVLTGAGVGSWKTQRRRAS